MEQWRERERAETSQAHRQTLNPIAWAGSRKQIVKDRGGKGGGGDEGKTLFSSPSSSSFSVQHTSESASSNAAACSLTVLYKPTQYSFSSPPTDCQCDGGAVLCRGIGGKPRGHKSIKQATVYFMLSAHFIKAHYHAGGCSLKSLLAGWRRYAG